MPDFRNAPIRQKLLVIIMITTTAALLLAGIGIVALDALLFRTALQRDLVAQASIVGDNSTAALSFDDPRAAEETLTALRARPHMVVACLYREDGALFARYERPQNASPCPPPSRDETSRFTSAGLTVSHPILLNGGRIGNLVLLYDLGEVYERIRLYAAVVLLILLLSSCLAFALSSRLRAIIAAPITRLAGAAGSVSESGDYSIRVEKDSTDELGILVDSFNEMLRRIQSRDVEIQNARNSLQTTLTSIGDAVISTDQNGRIVFANPVARALLRWPETEIAGTHIDDVFRLVNEFTRKKVDSPVWKVLREGTSTGLANHTVLIAQDGAEIPIDDSAAPIMHNGQTIGVVLVFRDITERRRAQQDSAYLAAIVESSDDAIVGQSPDGTVQTWNTGAERLYGYRAVEVIGRPLRHLLPPDRQHEEAEILKRLRTGNLIDHFETQRVRKDGSAIDVSLTISPIRNKSGEIVGVSEVARDITEQKRTAEKFRQTAKLESLGVLAGGIAHDFNNLLTGILGNASLALDDIAPGSAARPAIESVVSASERAAALAQQMLAYSGKGRFVVEQLDVSERVRDTLPLIRASIPPTVEVDLRLDQNLPAVEADPVQLQQVIMNIMINAAEAIPNGNPGAVTAIARREQVDGAVRAADGHDGELPPGSYICFEVTDTGCGMDEETKARIFDPFFTTKFTGRGLGLAAVLGIVRGHKGSIQVTSTPGNGSTFRVLLPALEAAQEHKGLAPQQQPAAKLRGNGLVLVVDDEQVVRNLAKHALERSGYQVLLAENGARGLDIYREQADRITCVVLDLTMPVMSGEETLVRMKAERKDIPIILSSGFNEVQAVRQFQGKGLAGFLQKPYRAAGLVEAIGRALSRYESTSAN